MCVLAASTFSWLSKLLMKHKDLQYVSASIFTQRVIPQSTTNPFTIVYMKTVGLVEILIKLVSLLLSVGVVAVIVKSKWNVRKLGGTISTTPPTKTRR